MGLSQRVNQYPGDKRLSYSTPVQLPRFAFVEKNWMTIARFNYYVFHGSMNGLKPEFCALSGLFCKKASRGKLNWFLVLERRQRNRELCLPWKERWSKLWQHLSYIRQDRNALLSYIEKDSFWTTSLNKKKHCVVSDCRLFMKGLFFCTHTLSSAWNIYTKHELDISGSLLELQGMIPKTFNRPVQRGSKLLCWLLWRLGIPAVNSTCIGTGETSASPIPIWACFIRTGFPTLFDSIEIPGTCFFHPRWSAVTMIMSWSPSLAALAFISSKEWRSWRKCTKKL